jgi:uncharacterized membrane protein YraQ (UPF0718 family)
MRFLFDKSPMSAAECSKPSATISTVVNALVRILQATWQVYLVASPYVLLGLAAAGLLHILIPAHKIARWLGKPGFGGMAKAAFLGIPLPLCSCAVVPVSIELSKKGASREASLAFLVSTPETGVDSIFLTYGLMGPIMAVMRPLAALLTSLVAAITSMIWRSREGDEGNLPTPGSTPVEEAPKSEREDKESGTHRFSRAVRYGFVEMVDEIGFWLVVGLLLTGVITALVPEQWIQGVLGEGPSAMLILLILGVPLYMCASASTPVGAALLLKGVSPGAALVFLLAGPATNASSLVVIARFFGRKFVAIYLSSVVITALATGYLFDRLLESTGWTVAPTLAAQHSEEASWITTASALVLGLLLLLSLFRGSWRMAIRELSGELASWRTLFADREATEDPVPPDDCCC